MAAEALAEVWEWDRPVGFTGAERLRLAFTRRLYRCGRLTEFTPGSKARYQPSHREARASS
jgi:hypothetical protein